MYQYQNYLYQQPGPYQYSPQPNAHQRLAQMEQQYQQYAQQNMFPTQMSGTSQTALQGKIVGDFETVKSTEIPLDGSVSYFPTANREYVYAKFLNMNTGSSDYEVYRRVSDEIMQEPKEEFDIKAYFDEKFEALKQELKGGIKNARKPNGKSDDSRTDE